MGYPLRDKGSLGVGLEGFWSSLAKEFDRFVRAKDGHVRQEASFIILSTYELVPTLHSFREEGGKKSEKGIGTLGLMEGT